MVTIDVTTETMNSFALAYHPRYITMHSYTLLRKNIMEVNTKRCTAIFMVR